MRSKDVTPSTGCVAYQGEPGSFSEAAARALLGADCDGVPCQTFEEMFAAVTTGRADCCVAPIENTLAGSVHRNYDLMFESGLQIRAETRLRIVHNLIAASPVSVDAIRRVYSHPVALAQCTRFLRQHPHVEAIAAADTAGSVREVLERGDPAEAAIASAQAAERYGGSIIVASIEDHAQNFTRFLLLSDGPIAIPVRGDRWKTSLVFRTPNRPGALHRALGVFADAGIDLAKIESRPVEGRPWEYSFYLDLAGSLDDARIAAAVEELQAMSEMVRVLGSYPAV